MFTDMPETDLQQYLGSAHEPDDFDAYWHRTLEEARQHAITLETTPVETGLRTLDTQDITFSGWGGHPIRA